jgi:hypothetical protein
MRSACEPPVEVILNAKNTDSLYNHHDRVIMVQPRAESRQRCVTITSCVHDHKLRDDNKLRDDQKLRVRSQIAYVCGPEQGGILESFGIVWNF